MELRDLQRQLANLGLSSVGKSERYVLANVENILYFLHLMIDAPFNAKHKPGNFFILGLEGTLVWNFILSQIKILNSIVSTTFLKNTSIFNVSNKQLTLKYL